MPSLLLAFLLAAPLFATEPENIEIRNLGTCGLVTRYASSQIKETCLTEAQNVYLDEDAGISRRKGSSKYNTTATNGAKAHRGMWPFRATDGTQYNVVLSSQTMFKTSGDGSYSAIAGLNNLSATQDMDCSQCLGRLWCVNGSNTMFSWDGTSTDTISTAPSCQAIDCFRNRVVLGNCSGSLSQIRLSGELDGEDYTIPTVAASTSPASMSVGGVNDGNRVIGFMGVYQDVLVGGKLDSTFGLYGFDRRDFVIREISREVGLIDNRSAREKQGAIYWLSKRGVEKMSGPSISRISDPIRDIVETIISAAGNSRSATDTTQADFEAGNLTASGAGAPISATISPGNILPTTFTLTDTAGADWGAFTSSSSVSTSAVSGALTLEVTTMTPLNAATLDGWTLQSNWIKTTTANSDCLPQDSPTQWLEFIGWNQSCGDLNSNHTSSVYIDTVAFTGGAEQQVANPTSIRSLTNTAPFTESCTLTTIEVPVATWKNQQGNPFNVRVSASVTGTPVVYYLAGQDSTTPLGRYLNISEKFYNTASNFCNYRIGFSTSVRYASSGSLVSREFNTGVSTPTIQMYSLGLSSSTETPVTFEYQTSSASGGPYGSLTALNLGVSVSTRQYVRYKASFSTSKSTKTARLEDITLTGTTTGYFIGQCRNPGTAITQWGLFQCNGAANDGSFTFHVSTGSSCHQVTRSTANWQSQTNNAVISYATSSFVSYRALFGVNTATATPTLNDCAFNWNEGTSRPSVAAEVYRDRYYLAYTTMTTGTPVNDQLLVLDSRDQWVMHDAPNCASLGIYNRQFYCGDSAASGFTYQMDIGQDDAGSAFTSKIKTKDFDFGNQFQKKNLKAIYYDLAGLPDPGYSIDLTPSYTLDASTDSFSLSTIGLDEDYSRFIAAKVAADASNNTSGRWFSFGLNHTGTQGPWKLFGLRFRFTRISED